MGAWMFGAAERCRWDAETMPASVPLALGSGA